MRVDDFLLNAFWCGGCGPAARGAMMFGEGFPPVSRSAAHLDYFAGALDIVAHELTHGLTDSPPA